MSTPLALVLLAGISGPALAEGPRISVLPFTGPGGNALRNQLVSELCEQATCVPHARVGRADKPDWKKARKEKVDYLVIGSVSAVKRRLMLELQVLKGPQSIKLRKAYPLDGRGALSRAGREAAVDALLMSVGASSLPEEPPRRVARAEPAPPAVEEEENARPLAPSEVLDEEDGSFERESPLVVLEAGPDLFARRFAFQSVATKNLRSYSADLVVAPRLKAEIYPLAALLNGLAAGVGLEVGYSMAVGLQSRRSDGPTHPTTLTRLDLAARLRFHPSEDSEGTLAPIFGYRSTRFEVRAAADGSKLEGLPGIQYSALHLGLAGELPVADDQAILFARVSYLPVLSSGEIISPAYFPNGSASGLEAAVGAGYLLAPKVEVRLTAGLTRYGLSFRTEESDNYVAAGAADLYLGANLSARYTY